jgi:phosphoribosyl-ATP pyrophosphohydrolase/phosphoribosyl-AMP cyclohydrolase
MITPTDLDWNKGQGLLPAIIQDAQTRQVLMLGYMNAAALKQTLATRRVTFFSRSKNRLWVKGETSGHVLQLVDVFADCDNDALLMLALPAGPTCHRGTPSCFGDETAPGLGFLAQLERTINQRSNDGDDTSYTRRLLDAGVKRIAQKVGEEGVETALAATAGDAIELANESADLLYHLLVLLRAKGLSLDAPLDVLRQRHRPKSPRIDAACADNEPDSSQQN